LRIPGRAFVTPEDPWKGPLRRPTIVAELASIAAAIAAGSLSPSPGDEDVHTFIERVLTERLGPVGGTLRAGCSTQR
jgi:argininosuccinate lyase